MSRGTEKYLTNTTPLFDKKMADRLQNIRVRMALTQTQFGRLLGVSQWVISRLEAHRSVTSEIPTGRFKAIMGMYFEHFITGEGGITFPRDFKGIRYGGRPAKRLTGI